MLPIPEEDSEGEPINTEVKDEEDKKEEEPEKEAEAKSTLFAEKVWVCKTTSGRSQVVLAQFKRSDGDTEKGLYEFRTIGKNQYGLLGQGADIKESKTFKPVDFGDMKINSIEEVVVGNLHVMMRLNGLNKVFTWGCYNTDNEERMVFKPTEVTFFTGKY